jgi:alkylhydroperoxidase/carboxymuconolactone decarboxylase family protein YurZ
MADPPWTPPPSGHRALADRLASAEVEPEPVVPRRLAPQAPSGGSGRGWLTLAVVVAVVAVFVAAGAAYVAYDNRSRAADWEERAFRLERNTEQLNGLLVERSTQLNERTRELNAIASKVTLQQNALARSESDVETLSERQRELAAEKAAVEDSRASLAVQSTALENVADSLVACNSGLFELFGFIVNGDQSSADTIVDEVSADCELAESQFAGYRARYG